MCRRFKGDSPSLFQSLSETTWKGLFATTPNGSFMPLLRKLNCEWRELLVHFWCVFSHILWHSIFEILKLTKITLNDFIKVLWPLNQTNLHKSKWVISRSCCCNIKSRHTREMKVYKSGQRLSHARRAERKWVKWCSRERVLQHILGKRLYK